MIFIIWSVAGLSFSAGPQQDQDTETPSTDITNTSLPSNTPGAVETDPPSSTATDFSTNTPLPTSTVEEQETETPFPTATDLAPALPSSTSTVQPLEINTLPPPVHLSGNFVPDEVLIRFRPRADNVAIDQCFQTTGASVESEIDQLVVYLLKVPNGSVAQAIASLSLCPNIRYVEPNYIAQMVDTIPSDSAWSLQYGLVNIRAPQGWDLSTGSPAVKIAIVDSGVDLGHPDLGAKIVSGYDFVNGDNVPQDDNGHGTHVAGIAAAVSNNGTGVAGVSWGALIMPVKVLNAGGNGTFANVSSGIIWAADHGAQIINLSLGGSSPSSVLQDAVNYAYSKGVTLVAAAGNTGSNFVLYPARYPHVIAVAATDGGNNRASFSNFGPEIALSAPGVSIYSTTLGGSYGYLSGTSMSAPFVSGLAAILRGIPGSSGSPDVIAWEMETTALDLGPGGFDDLYGYGLIQMDRAIRLAIPPTATPAPAQKPDEGNGNPSSSQAGSLFYTPTFTPTPTWTPTITPTLILATPTFFTLTPGTSETAEISAQDVPGKPPAAHVRLAPRLGRDWPIGASGVVLILMGVVLGGILKRRQSRRPRRRQYFKVR